MNRKTIQDKICCSIHTHTHTYNGLKKFTDLSNFPFCGCVVNIQSIILFGGLERRIFIWKNLLMICFGGKLVTKLLYTIFVWGIFNINFGWSMLSNLII